MSLPVLLTILAGCSWIGTGIVAWSSRRKVKAEASKAGADAAAVLTGSALQLLEAVQAEAAGLRKELKETRAELTAVRGHMGVLEGLLRASGVAVPEFVYPPLKGVN